MEFNYTFYGSSTVQHRGDQTALSFAPDIQRAPTYFTGELRQGVAFREAISALHDVVVSDLRWKPKDKEAYKAWAAQQELIDWETRNRGLPTPPRPVPLPKEGDGLPQVSTPPNSGTGSLPSPSPAPPASKASLAGLAGFGGLPL